MFTSLLTNLVSILISTAGAIEGQFTYNGHNVVQSMIRYENVYTPSQAGKDRLAVLESEEYVCQPKPQFVQCRKIFPGLPALPPDMNYILPSVQTATFGKIESIAIISQGDDVTISEAAQLVTVDGTQYNKATYLQNGELTKATVGDADDTFGYHSFIIYADTVSVFDSVTLTESKWAFRTYLVEFYLTQQ